MRFLFRLLLVLVLIFAVFLSATGIVFVFAEASPVELAAGEEWFPCMGHHCGCRDAASCRAHCCCAVSKPVVVKKKSCCSDSGEEGELVHDKAETPAAEKQEAGSAGVGIRLEVRSAACAGGESWSGGKNVSWVLEWHPMKRLSPAQVGVVVEMAAQVQSQLAARPAVPPPRG